MTQSRCNYLNALKPVEQQLFQQAFGTASAALPRWQHCSTELHPPPMASGWEEQPLCPETERKNGLIKLMMPEGYSCAEQVIWLLVVSYTTCNGSAGAATLAGAHLSALSEKFGVDISLGAAEIKLSCQTIQPVASHQSSSLGFVVNCFTHCFFVVHRV